jgi:predicted DNA-binding protein
MGEADTGMKQVVTTMTPELSGRVAALAEALGMSVATLLRVAVIQYVRNYERNAAPAVVSTEEMIERL